MTPNWSRQLGLAALLVALGFAAYWVEFKQKPKEEAAEELSKKVADLKDVQIQSITLADQTRTFEFSCSDFDQKLCKPGDNSKWQITAPRKTKADDASVNGLISSVNNLMVTDTIDLADESPEKRAALLKEYGLDPETRKQAKRLVLKTPGRDKDKETVIEFGAVHPIGESIFALANGNENKVYLIPNHFKSNFEHELTHWRDKKILTLANHDVISFRLDGPKGLIEGERKDSNWTLRAKGETLPGDIENIDSLLSGATYLTAKEFVSDSKEDSKAKAVLSGAKKLASIALEKSLPKEAKDAVVVLLTLYQKGDAKSGKLYATVSNADPLYEVDLHHKDRFDKGVKDLRLQKLVTSMERFGARKLQFSGGALKSPLTIEQKDGKWMIDGKEANNDKVQQVLDRLTGNRIREFITQAPSGEDKGTTVSLTDEKGVEKRKLVFWKSGDRLYARDLLAKRKEALVVDPAIEEALPKDSGHFELKPAPAASPSGKT